MPVGKTYECVQWVTCSKQMAEVPIETVVLCWHLLQLLL